MTFQVDISVVHSSNETVPENLLSTLPVKAVQKEVDKTPLESNYHLIIGKELTSEPEVLNNVTSGVKTGGFVLSEEKNLNLNESLYEKVGLCVVSLQKTSESTFVLLRKVKKKKNNNFVVLRTLHFQN